MIVGGLWYRETEKVNPLTGKPTVYYTGYISVGIFGKIRICVFENSLKDTDRSPDYNIVLSKKPTPIADDPVQELPDNPEYPF